MSEGNVWRTCSACKKGIPYNSLYWTCNVSTCNRKRTGVVFCSVVALMAPVEKFVMIGQAAVMASWMAR